MTQFIDRAPAQPRRRQLLGLITGLGALWLLRPLLARAAPPAPARPAPSLHEAEFYHPHDAASET